MAQTIKIKRSTLTSVPTALENGELAYSANSNKLFVGRPGGTTGDIDAIGGKFYTDIITGATNLNTASKLVLRDASGNFNAGTITATITGNVTGDLTGNSAGIHTGAVTGDLTGDSAGIHTGNVTGDLTGNSAGIHTGNVTGNLTGNSAGIHTGAVTGDLTGDSAGIHTGNVTGNLTGNSAGIHTGAVTGEVTGNASTATALATARTITIAGDVDATGVAFDGTGNISLTTVLDTVNANVGQFGSTTAVPIVTVNAKGLVTAVTTAAIVTSWNLAADTGTTDAIAGGETLTVSGGTGVDTVVSANAVSIAIGQPVATTDNVTFNSVTVDGTLTSDDITAATMTASGNVIVSGNLTVNGTTTTVNSNTIAIGDAIMTLNNDEAGTPSADAGLEVERGTSTNVSMLWNETSDYWQVNDGTTTSKIMTAGNFAASFTGILDGGTY